MLKTLDNPFFVAIQRGFEKTAQGRFKVVVRAGSSESDLEGQRTQLRAWVPTSAAHQVKGLAITPSSSGPELIPDLKRFQDRGVPLILVDTLIDRDVLATHRVFFNVGLQSDNVRGGGLAADALVGRLSSTKAAPTIVILEGALDSDTAQQRRLGFERRLQQLALERKLAPKLVRRVANWRREEARQMTAALMGREGGIDGIFAANDEMALGAVRAYSAAGRPPPPIVGFDAIPDAISAIRRREMVATIAQDPGKMGVRAAQYLLDPKLPSLRFHVEKIPVLTCDPACR